MTLSVKIAGINVLFKGDLDEPFIKRLNPYKESFKNPEIVINYSLSQEITLPADKKLIKQVSDRTWFYHNGRFCFADYNEQIGKYMICASIGENEADIFVYDLKDENEIGLINEALRAYKKTMPNIKEREAAESASFKRECLLLNSTDQVMRYIMLYHKTLYIHSSAIAKDNAGIIFSAPSGTGKSTHTALWERYYNAEILNDDAPFITANGDSVILHGAPWAGTSGINKNKSVPLKAIVFLEQAKENSIEPLMPLMALQYLLRELIKPCDPALIDNVYTMLNLIIAEIPCYLLKCTPEKEAADVAYNEIFKN